MNKWRAIAEQFARGPPPRRRNLDPTSEVLRVLGAVLNIENRIGRFTPDTPLLGSVPELDSMAVVSLLTALEEKFGIAIDDDEIDGSTFASVGSLIDFVRNKLQA